MVFNLVTLNIMPSSKYFLIKQSTDINDDVITCTRLYTLALVSCNSSTENNWE